MNNRLYFLITMLCFAIFSDACTSDKLVQPMLDCVDTTPVWEGEVDALVALTCAYAGCHVSGTNAPGNYLSYSGISGDLRDGDFRNRVFDIMDNPVRRMPPNYSDGPTELTEAQLLTFSCWMEAGFPEN